MTYLDCFTAFAMTGIPLLSAMASGVIARHEAIQRADNKQITKHVIDCTRFVQKLKAKRRSSPGQRAVLDCHVATLPAMTEIPLLSAMASDVIARSVATWQSSRITSLIYTVRSISVSSCYLFNY
jgi:hypothetical protein